MISGNDRKKRRGATANRRWEAANPKGMTERKTKTDKKD
jgi:hypothetical protein